MHAELRLGQAVRGERRLPALILAALLALCGCLSPQPMPYPPVRVELGRFSFLPPDEPGWLRGPATREQFTAVRHGDTPDESYALHALLDEQVPPEAAQLGMVEFLRRKRAEQSSGPGADERFSGETLEVQDGAEVAPGCARLVGRSMDHSPSRSSGRTDAMALNSVSFLCLHPRASGHAILLGYSQRCYPGDEDPELAQKAARLVATLEYAP